MLLLRLLFSSLFFLFLRQCSFDCSIVVYPSLIVLFSIITLDVPFTFLLGFPGYFQFYSEQNRYEINIIKQFNMVPCACSLSHQWFKETNDCICILFSKDNWKRCICYIGNHLLNNQSVLFVFVASQFIQRKVSPVSILYKSIAGRYRPVSYPDWPITACYRFIKNASWVCSAAISKNQDINKCAYVWSNSISLTLLLITRIKTEGLLNCSVAFWCIPWKCLVLIYALDKNNGRHILSLNLFDSVIRVALLQG